MGDGETAAGKLGEERLNVALERTAMRRVADMANGAAAGEPVDDGALGKAVADDADPPFLVKLVAVEGNDATRLLPAMLERVEA